VTAALSTWLAVSEAGRVWQCPEHVSEREPLSERAWRFARALVVGSGATIVDFALLSTCIRVVGMSPTAARLPALCAGASLQFFGNRSFTFRAQSGSLSRQARFFVAAELVTLGLNFGLFSWLAPRVHGVPPELLSFVGTFVVFVTFAYPMRRLVIFKLPS
jgi:putative flippase GtrA